MRTKSLAYLWVLFVTLSLCGTAIAAEILGRVVGIQDGDTITVLDANKTVYKIRLTGNRQ